MALTRINPPAAQGDRWTLKRVGAVAYMRLRNQTERELTIPEPYRPVEDMTFSYRFGTIDVRTSGTVTIRSGDYNGGIWHSMSWPIL